MAGQTDSEAVEKSRDKPAKKFSFEFSASVHTGDAICNGDMRIDSHTAHPHARGDVPLSNGCSRNCLRESRKLGIVL
jgi:hypothetical protein